jgi:hypothetical protein
MTKNRRGAARRLLIERAAIAAADDWVKRLSDELSAERRVAAGGWPGTLSEARNCTRAYVIERLRKSESTPPTADELEFAARTSYARARTQWLSSAAAVQDPFEEDAADSI